MVTWPSCIVQLQHEWSSDGTDDGTIIVKYVLSGPLCIVQLDDMQSWAVVTRLLTHKDKNFLAVYLQILNWLQSWRLFIRRWSQCWYWVTWTTGTPLWSEFWLSCVVISNLCSTPLPYPSLALRPHHWDACQPSRAVRIWVHTIQAGKRWSSLHVLAPQYLVDNLIHG